jgi:hypothetical protein
MNLFSLLIAATLVASDFPALAQGDAVGCQFSNAKSTVIIKGGCTRKPRLNSDGFIVHDVIWPDGVKATYRFECQAIPFDGQGGHVWIKVGGSTSHGIYKHPATIYAVGIEHDGGSSTSLHGEYACNPRRY